MMPFKNIAGQRFGRLMVIDIAGKTNRGGLYWNCTCDCGNSVVVASGNIISNNTKSCGCLKKDTTRKLFSKPVGLAAKDSKLRQYKRHANAQKLVFDLNDNYMLELFAKNCHYCGNEPLDITITSGKNGVFIGNGIDRINSESGYTIDNTVTCCKKCNMMKKSMSKDEFYEWIDRVQYFQSLPFLEEFNLTKSIVQYSYRTCRRGAKRRNIEFELSYNHVRYLSSCNCSYCGKRPSVKAVQNRKFLGLYTGIDRINNSIGYIQDNVVSCCPTCNYAKWEMSVSDFISQVKKIYNHNMFSQEYKIQ